MWQSINTISLSRDLMNGEASQAFALSVKALASLATCQAGHAVRCSDKNALLVCGRRRSQRYWYDEPHRDRSAKAVVSRKKYRFKRKLAYSRTSESGNSIIDQIDLRGYLHPEYAASLSEWGKPRELTVAGGWVLERTIPDTSRRDATGCYPLMACRNWSRLEDDFAHFADEWVSFVAVPDPLGAPGEAELRKLFADHVRPFKAHYTIELATWSEAAKPVHRARVRQGDERVTVEVRPAIPADIDQWDVIYAELIARKQLSGLHTFSRAAFETLLQVPGVYISRAAAKGETVCMSIWVTHADCVYSHLTASTAIGYELSAAYPMIDRAIRYFQSRSFALIDLGGGAGLDDDATDGLASFKRGWSNSVRQAYICGRIFDHAAYRSLTGERTTDYFPAYRSGEFN